MDCTAYELYLNKAVTNKYMSQYPPPPKSNSLI